MGDGVARDRCELSGRRWHLDPPGSADLPSLAPRHHALRPRARHRGLAIAGPLLAWLFWWVATRRGHDVRLRAFLVLSYTGLLMHAFLDVLLSYGMRPWLPFDGTWYYADVIFVADPWVWVMFGVGAILGGARRGAGFWAWCVFAVATVVAVALAHFGGRAPVHAGWILAGLWTIVLGLRASGALEGQRSRCARISLAFVALYLVFMLFMGRANHARGVEELSKRFDLDGKIERTSSVPRLCIPWANRIIVQTADELFRTDVNALSGAFENGVRLRRNLSAPRLERLRGTRVFETWQGFARHSFAGRLDEEGAWILGSARYSWGVRESWCNLRVDDR